MKWDTQVAFLFKKKKNMKMIRNILKMNNKFYLNHIYGHYLTVTQMKKTHFWRMCEKNHLEGSFFSIEFHVFFVHKYHITPR